MTPEEFSLVQLGDRLVFPQFGKLSTVVDRNDTTLYVDHDRSWNFTPVVRNLYANVSNEVSVEDKTLDKVLVALPLSEIYVGAVLESASNPGTYFTVDAIVPTGFVYSNENGDHLFRWEDVANNSGPVGSKTSVEYRLRMLFTPNMSNLERVQHPVHNKESARPSLETLSPGQRFHDGVHAGPTFYTVLASDEYIAYVENSATLDIETFSAPDLANMFQSLQVSQLNPGITIYRVRGQAQMNITQTVDRIENGYVHYTEDSVINRPEVLLNQACSFEQRKMYFSV